MDPLLSIVVPIFNAERYIDRCFATIHRQGLNPNEYEVVIVDDGSTDSSLELCKQKARQEDNVLVVHQINSGAGAARNAGIKHSSGRYVYCLDVDDDLEDGSLGRLVRRCLDDDLDVLFFGGVVDYEKPELAETNWQDPRYFQRRQKPGITTGERMFIDQRSEENFCAQPCMLIAKRAYILSEGIFFAEGIINEDNLYVLRATIRAKRVDVDPAAYFHYIVRSGSVTTNNTSGAKRAIAHAVLANEFELERLHAEAHGKIELAQVIDGLILWFIDIAIEAMTPDQSLRDKCLAERRDLALAARLLHLLDEQRRRNDALDEAMGLLKSRAETAERRVRELEESTTWKVGCAITAIPRAIKDAIPRRRMP